MLANADPCDQPNAADSLVELSKQLNSTEMVVHAQIFAQQARNSVGPIPLTQWIFILNKYFSIQPNSVYIPYCQKPPRNSELEGLFPCQFAGSNPNVFAGNLAVGEPGTIPLGKTAPLSPPGSCPAHPQGPIADGTQLSDIATTPFAPGSSDNATDTGSDGMHTFLA